MIFSVFQKNWVLGYSWSTLLWYQCYYLHRSRYSMSRVCGIFKHSFMQWQGFYTLQMNTFLEYCPDASWQRHKLMACGVIKWLQQSDSVCINCLVLFSLIPGYSDCQHDYSSRHPDSSPCCQSNVSFYDGLRFVALPSLVSVAAFFLSPDLTTWCKFVVVPLTGPGAGKVIPDWARCPGDLSPEVTLWPCDLVLTLRLASRIAALRLYTLHSPYLPDALLSFIDPASVACGLFGKRPSSVRPVGPLMFFFTMNLLLVASASSWRFVNVASIGPCLGSALLIFPHCQCGFH